MFLQKGSVPVTTITAHTGRIYGIDWDRRSRHQIVTCSLDKTIKFWSINELDRANNAKYQANVYFPSLPSPDQPMSTIHTNNPVWRARNLPFGKGVLSLPQRGESSLEMWGTEQGQGPIERFEEYGAPVKEFVWRSRGGGDPNCEDREFQLVTWSKDRQLRTTPISLDTLEVSISRRWSSLAEWLISRTDVNDLLVTHSVSFDDLACRLRPGSSYRCPGLSSKRTKHFLRQSFSFLFEQTPATVRDRLNALFRLTR